ncbi:MAG: acetyl-CoA acetyltransferase family protein [Planctomycetota bacterium]|jgi:acetyl-CoA acetyltransferase family protein
MPGVQPSRSIVLAAGLRTPFVKAGGVYSGEDAGHLGARLVRELLLRTGIEVEAFDELICGCVGPPHDQANVGRVISLRAGLPVETPARTVARNCASGIEAVTQAATEIMAGNGELYMCLGVEVMSAYPLIVGEKMSRMFSALARARSLGARLAAIAKFRPSHLAPRVALMEGLTDPTTGLIMGKTAELLARDFGITRAEADSFACESHRRARDARDAGRFDREVLAHLPRGARKPKSVRADDGIRDNQTVMDLARMRPYFEKPDGQVTIGNSCGISDGAAALIVTTEERARELGLKPLARIRSWAWEGLDPSRMGLGPVFASASAMSAAGVTLGDIDRVELNEAFAAQVLACRRAFASKEFARKHAHRFGGSDKALGELDPMRLNVNGGAIALGHPVGATGGRLLLTAAHELQHADGELALATLCIGGGQGGAMVLERLAS